MQLHRHVQAPLSSLAARLLHTGPSEPLRDYLTRWTELRNSYEGVHEVQAIHYFIDDCQDDTLLKHKLMCSESTTLVQLMVIVDEYGMTESSMKVLVFVDAADKPTMAKPAAAPATDRSEPD